MRLFIAVIFMFLLTTGAQADVIPLDEVNVEINEWLKAEHLVLTHTSSGRDDLSAFMQGQVVIYGEGVGNPTLKNASQRRLMAEKAAELSAYRSAVENQESFRFVGNTTFKDIAYKDDTTEKYLMLMLAVIEIVKVSYSKDKDIATAVVRAPLTGQDGMLAKLFEMVFNNGSYLALIIGNNEYQKLDRLQTAVNDAREVDRTLREQYGFQTQLLLNATRNDILTAFNDLRRRVKEDDNVLVYYAGHGEFDRSADKAFWLPVDAQPDNDTEWIIADNITASVKRLSSKHVLIVSDSCYSGTLSRSAQTHLQPGERNELLKKMSQRQSRSPAQQTAGSWEVGPAASVQRPAQFRRRRRGFCLHEEAPVKPEGKPMPRRAVWQSWSFASHCIPKLELGNEKHLRWS
jgi:hypothetical protein